MSQLQLHSSAFKSQFTVQLLRTNLLLHASRVLGLTQLCQESFNQANSLIQCNDVHTVLQLTSVFSTISSTYLLVCLLLMCCRFDLLASGGASLTLSFERAPFLTQYRTVWVPWNVFYVMDTLIMKKVSCVCVDIITGSWNDDWQSEKLTTWQKLQLCSS